MSITPLFDRRHPPQGIDTHFQRMNSQRQAIRLEAGNPLNRVRVRSFWDSPSGSGITSDAADQVREWIAEFRETGDELTPEVEIGLIQDSAALEGVPAEDVWNFLHSGEPVPTQLKSSRKRAGDAAHALRAIYPSIYRDYREYYSSPADIDADYVSPGYWLVTNTGAVVFAPEQDVPGGAFEYYDTLPTEANPIIDREWTQKSYVSGIDARYTRRLWADTSQPLAFESLSPMVQDAIRSNTGLSQLADQQELSLAAKKASFGDDEDEWVTAEMNKYLQEHQDELPYATLSDWMSTSPDTFNAVVGQVRDAWGDLHGMTAQKKSAFGSERLPNIGDTIQFNSDADLMEYKGNGRIHVPAGSKGTVVENHPEYADSPQAGFAVRLFTESPSVAMPWQVDIRENTGVEVEVYLSPRSDFYTDVNWEKVGKRSAKGKRGNDGRKQGSFFDEAVYAPFREKIPGVAPDKMYTSGDEWMFHFVTEEDADAFEGVLKSLGYSTRRSEDRTQSGLWGPHNPMLWVHFPSLKDSRSASVKTSALADEDFSGYTGDLDDFNEFHDWLRFDSPRAEQHGKNMDALRYSVGEDTYVQRLQEEMKRQRSARRKRSAWPQRDSILAVAGEYDVSLVTDELGILYGSVYVMDGDFPDRDPVSEHKLNATKAQGFTDTPVRGFVEKQYVVNAPEDVDAAVVEIQQIAQKLGLVSTVSDLPVQLIKEWAQNKTGKRASGESDYIELAQRDASMRGLTFKEYVGVQNDETNRPTAVLYNVNENDSTLAVRIPQSAFGKRASYSESDARALGEKLGVNFDEVDFAQFVQGLNTELEHKETIEEGGDLDTQVANTVLDHLGEEASYYTKLKQVEGQKHKQSDIFKQGLHSPVRERPDYGMTPELDSESLFDGDSRRSK